MAGLSGADLDREIRLQVGTPGTASTESGDVQLEWDDVTEEVNPSGYVDAQWFQAGATETWRAGFRLEATAAGVYRIQYRSTLPTPDKSRIIGHDGRYYDIVGVTEIGRQEGLDLTVVASDSQGDTV